MLCVFNRLKKILVILLVLTLTGCTASYSITINDMNDVRESLDVKEDNKDLFDKKSDELSGSTFREYLETDLKWPTPIDKNSEINPLEPIKIEGISYYNKKNISSDSQLGIRYSYNFKTKDFINSNVLNICYEYKYNISDNIATFETTSNFKCFEDYPLLESVKFNLNSKCQIESNASVKNEGIHIWNIEKKGNQRIKFTIDCNPKKENFKIPFSVVIPIYALLIGLVILFLKASYKIHNKI